ncbi:MAG: prephenate dehydrogenase [Candidatus Omnitrophica bacterium]|nr:prephenate dehydrogenase [Candidatus Omnitrophota bacterium]MBU4479421.1 prephenate dehydrogenase [Candidatus Omnitrophota bacterium]MCG2703966.1 prephenate dehydrogenase [Candidatus Omnitrophota bacterium]
MQKAKFKKAVIVGPGLIGGSIGLELRSKKMASRVIGVARHMATLRTAQRKGSIDTGSTDLMRAVSDADLVVLAVPVGAIKKTIIRIKDSLKPGCIVFDVGSTKQEIVRTAERYLPQQIFFVGAHPMAGSEKAGPEFAESGLFVDSLCFITKTSRTDVQAFSRVDRLWKEMGAKTVIIEPAEHDEIVAQVSHLPHMVSAALVDSVKDAVLPYASSGFRDTTRIAAGSPQLWSDIFLSNKKSLLRALGIFEKKISELKKSLNNEARLMQKLAGIKRKRDTLT